MKKILIPIVFLLFSMTVFAQQSIEVTEPSGNSNNSRLLCGTEQPTPEQIRYTLDVIAKQYIGRNSGTTCVPLKAYVVQKSDGTGGVTTLALNQGVANLNKVYKGAGIEFYWAAPPQYANDDDYYDMSQQSPDSDNNTGLRALFTPATNAINIYYCGGLKNSTGGGLNGYAYYPSSSTSTNMIVMRNGAQVNAVNGTFAHEMGHYFSLQHTHDGTENGNTHANAENVPRTGANANCSTKGDLLCDTHADPTGSIANCVYTGGATDINGVAYTPPVENIMSYYSDDCGVPFFTPEQNIRIAQALVTRQGYTSYTINAAPMVVNNPSSLTVSQSTLSAVLSWTDNASNEMGYLIERSSTSSSSGFEALGFGAVDANITTYTDANVRVGTTYYYRIKASNDNCNDYSNVFSFTPIPAYCSPSYTTVCYADAAGIPRYIGSVTVKTTANAVLLTNSNSGCTAAISDFTALSANVTVGTSYNITVNGATFSGSCFNQNVGIWLDTNGDKDFEDAGEYLGNGTTSGCAVTIGISIPVGTYNGARRLRIRSIRTTETMASAVVCGNFAQGETEDYTLNVSGGTALAVELVDFKAVLDKQMVRLNWQVADEKDVNYYQIERSFDGKTFIALEKIEKGTFLSQDKTPQYGANYYRLKIVENDGSVHYSPIRSVDFGVNKKTDFKIYPNPTADILNVQFNSETTQVIDFELFNTVGQLVYSYKLDSKQGNNHLFFKTAHLPNGVYALRIKQGNGMTVEKVVID